LSEILQLSKLAFHLLLYS